MTEQTPQTSELTTAILLGLLGLGCGLALPSTIAAAVLSVPLAEGGMASASVNMFRQVGSALGASVTGTIITTGIASRLPGALASRGIPAHAQTTIAHAMVADRPVHGAPAGIRTAVQDAAGSSFADALHVAVLSIGIGTIVMTIAAVVLLAGRPRSAGPAPLSQAGDSPAAS